LAQSVSTSGTQAASFHILDQRTVYFGQHAITLNLVEPPTAPIPVAPPASGLAVPPPKPTHVVADDQLLFFLATVYDHQFTVLQWSEGDQELAAVSNIDFNYLTTNDDFSAGGVFYEIMPVLSNESSADADPATAAWLARAESSLRPSVPGYLIVSGSAGAGDLQALEALHAYFGASAGGLEQAYLQQQAQIAAEQRLAKLHPPTRPNTVIYFWPIKSSVYPTGSSQ